MSPLQKDTIDKKNAGGLRAEVLWHNQVLSTSVFARSGIVTLGRDFNADICIPTLPANTLTRPIAFIDETGEYFAYEKDFALPDSLSLRFFPLERGLPPQAGIYTGLEAKDKAALIASVLISLFMWFLINHTPQTKVLMPEEKTLIQRVRVTFPKITADKASIPVVKSKATKNSALKNINESPQNNLLMHLKQTGTKHANSNDLLDMAKSTPGLQTLNAGHSETRTKSLNMGTYIGDTNTVAIGRPNTKGKSTTFNSTSNTSGTGLNKISSQITVPSTEKISVTGNIDREAIRAVILSNRRALQSCYERFLARDSDLYGRVYLQWDIVSDGRPQNPLILENTMQNSSVANCIIVQLKSWRFPTPPAGQVARVKFPFMFSAQ